MTELNLQKKATFCSGFSQTSRFCSGLNKVSNKSQSRNFQFSMLILPGIENLCITILFVNIKASYLF